MLACGLDLNHTSEGVVLKWVLNPGTTLYPWVDYNWGYNLIVVPKYRFRSWSRKD